MFVGGRVLLFFAYFVARAGFLWKSVKRDNQAKYDSVEMKMCRGLKQF